MPLPSSLLRAGSSPGLVPAFLQDRSGWPCYCGRVRGRLPHGRCCRHGHRADVWHGIRSHGDLADHRCGHRVWSGSVPARVRHYAIPPHSVAVGLGCPMLCGACRVKTRPRWRWYPTAHPDQCHPAGGTFSTAGAPPTAATHSALTTRSDGAAHHRYSQHRSHSQRAARLANPRMLARTRMRHACSGRDLALTNRRVVARTRTRKQQAGSGLAVAAAAGSLPRQQSRQHTAATPTLPSSPATT
jgi:hypothetical protein